MKKVTIDCQSYYYNPKLGFLFYDKKGAKQVHSGVFNYWEYISFLKQIAIN